VLVVLEVGSQVLDQMGFYLDFAGPDFTLPYFQVRVQGSSPALAQKARYITVKRTQKS
jgi:hypothetical protein